MTKLSEQELSEQEALKSAKSSYLYALNILKGRFEKGEDVISKDAYYSYCYARDVLKGRFEKGEDVISKSDEYSKLYKKNIYDAEKKLKKEIKEIEKLRNSITVHYLYGAEI